MATEYKHSTYNFLAINLTLIYCTENARRYLEHGEVLFNKFYGDYDEPYKFGGHEKDNESGMTYAGARYLWSEGDFTISTDPHWFQYPHITSYNWSGNNPVMLIDKDGRDWILSTGDRVYWYGGNYGDKSNLMHTYKATSGMNEATLRTIYSDGHTVDKTVNVQNSKYQNVRNGGPTPEGKYRINLQPSPDRTATANLKTGDLERSPEGGIEQIPSSVAIPDKPGYVWTYTDWGNVRAKLDPVNVTGATPTDRDLNSFYFHDSEKGYSHGCTEVEGSFFEQLKNYRNAGNASIDVKIDYPNNNHNTNGGTKKVEGTE